jgi:hypothetical protein
MEVKEEGRTFTVTLRPSELDWLTWEYFDLAHSVRWAKTVELLGKLIQHPDD